MITQSVLRDGISYGLPTSCHAIRPSQSLKNFPTEQPPAEPLKVGDATAQRGLAYREIDWTNALNSRPAGVISRREKQSWFDGPEREVAGESY